MLNTGKKDEDSGDAGIYYNLDKSVVLQETRAFNETPLNPRKCRTIITKMVYLMYQSETFQRKEATEAFFAITKLFQNQDPALRQMVYLAIKELADIADDVIMVTSSLTRDMNQKSDVIYRANAIRALTKITDSSMLQGIERFLKQAIVDKNASVSSAAIVSALHLVSSNREAVKRWANEVQEAINSKGVITQYHALGLLYQIRQHDRMAVIKMIQNYSRGALRSPFAYCMLIRYASKIMDEEDGNGRSMYELLESWLRHKNDMVVYEAAKAICNLKDVTSKELFPAVSALQLMLVNHKPTLRFAAIRTLNKLAMTHPTATGNEASVDRLMKQITGFMSEISDEFKIIVIDAIRSLCLKFPAKQSLMLGFLSNVLRDEGGFEYKRAIVEAMFDIIHHVPESKESALSHLCEFIEDCEFTKLAVRILYLLGTEGPKTKQPSKFIRYIYNRVILENATVRAAAVSALSRFAVEIGDLRERIKVLLTRCLDDADDEVRDRATMYLRVLESEELCKKYITNETTFAWASLERSLINYISDESAHSVPFDISSTPVVTKAQEEAERQRTRAAQHETVASPSTPSNAAASAKAASKLDPQTQYAREMEKIPQLAVLGPLFKSSKGAELTESETEYVVTCVKHIFPQHLVFQFTCKNTLQEQILENVTIQMSLEAAEDESASQLLLETVIPAPVLTYEAEGVIYVVYKRPNGICPIATFSNMLKYTVKEIDPSTNEPQEDGYEDEYSLEDVELQPSDYVSSAFIVDFPRAWDELGDENEVVETYELTAVPNIKTAVSTMLDLLGMQPCDNTGTVRDTQTTTHTLYLAGTFVGGFPLLARTRMAFATATGVTMELAVRSTNLDAATVIANAIS
ncbi:coatomer subunit gamma [Nowakowskiella sp. JEL0407]|nr:coatomer subunit gamma [Nowakowskiella sp. JEL0407]